MWIPSGALVAFRVKLLSAAIVYKDVISSGVRNPRAGRRKNVSIITMRANKNKDGSSCRHTDKDVLRLFVLALLAAYSFEIKLHFPVSMVPFPLVCLTSLVAAQAV